MSKTLTIPANEAGIIRVFALSMDSDEARALKANRAPEVGPLPQESALGCHGLNDAHVEVFALSDLGDLSLVDYLIEGADARPDALEADRLKLSRLDGWVMIVHSSAFGGTAQGISPAATLTLIGSYPQQNVDWTGPVTLTSEAAKPYSGAAPAKKRPSDAAMSGRIAMLALLVAFGVVGLMLWVGS